MSHSDEGIAVACDGSRVVVTVFDRMTGERMSHDMGAMEALWFSERVLREAVVLLIRERANRGS